ncbi:EAL domain-containing protein [Hahella sp. SMD15-11]|uniref:protein-glutamate O-methyltransferase n=1 Tax=Thermohahella caldifontis TaxID=3142973 RepID=A0AB39USG1_9GAMM
MADQTATPDTQDAMYVAGIGASAGGLEALRPLVAALEPTGRACYIVAQHMAPDHRSLLIDLLAREARLPVVQARNNARIQPDMIYVAPAGKDILVSKNVIRIRKPRKPLGAKPSVDLLLTSLAESHGARAIGVVLSGTGSDGTLGIKAIREAGGITLAQSLDTAKYVSMPQSAMRDGAADCALPPEAIARRIQEHALNTNSSTIRIEAGNDDISLPKLIRRIARHTGIDFSAYKEGTIERQLSRRIAAKGLPSLEAYWAWLDEHPDELSDLASSFLICVTAFFRDPKAYEAIKPVLRAHLLTKPPGSDIRIWVPACATGEEAYSLAILLEEILGDQVHRHDIRIFATDVHEEALKTARLGRYPELAVEGLSHELIEKYFQPDEGMYRVGERLRKRVLFSRHDVIQNPPFLRLDLISCRNLLIYFRPELQEAVLDTFHYALNGRGILWLGSSETVHENSRLWVEVDRAHRIYQRREGAQTRPHSSFRLPGLFRNAKARGTLPAEPHPLETLGSELLMNDYVPPAILMSQDGGILRLFGDCSPFVRLPRGKAELDLFNLIIPEFRGDLRAGVHIVLRRDTIYRGSPVQISTDHEDRRFRLVIRQPEALKIQAEDVVLVIFEPVSASTPPSRPVHPDDPAVREHIRELEEELAVTRDRMQTVIEELETSNEELKALNEETQATGEELLASNAELEAANEELQAANEELNTLNEELRHTNEALTAANEDLRNILDSLQKALVVLDANLLVRRFNEEAKDFFDLTEQSKGISLLNIRTRYSMTGLAEKLHAVLETGTHEEVQFSAPDRHYRARLTPYMRDDQTGTTCISGVLLSIQDITAEYEQQQRDRLHASVFEHAAEGILITDEHNRILAANPAFQLISGYTEAELLGRTPAIFRSPNHDQHFFRALWQELLKNGSWSGEMENRRKDGTRYWVYLSIAMLRDEHGKASRFIAVFNDITEFKQAKDVIEYQANYDSLTGLPNRNLVIDRLREALKRLKRTQTGLCLMFLDLDNFKDINDSLGHDTGDRLLQVVAERIRKTLRETDTVGRLGGDEFLIILPDIRYPEDAAQTATTLLERLSEPVQINDLQIATAASIGLTLAPADGRSAEQLMRNADSALYAAKDQGRNRYSFFTQDQQEEAIQRQWLRSELAHALDRGELHVHYQPIVSLASGEIVGAEALMRWKHPSRGSISPATFIPIAEHSGLINSLSLWMARTAVRDMATLNEKLNRHLYVSVNLSVNELLMASHVDDLIRCLNTAGMLDAGLVSLELTENLAMEKNSEQRHNLLRLKEAGCRIALDDFGTGYSSLSYLKNLPIDVIKVDRSFTRDLMEDPEDASMVNAICDLARSFGMQIIVEGVETADQLTFFRHRTDCLIQGYFFARPLPLAEFERFVTNEAACMARLLQHLQATSL